MASSNQQLGIRFSMQENSKVLVSLAAAPAQTKTLRKGFKFQRAESGEGARPIRFVFKPLPEARAQRVRRAISIRVRARHETKKARSRLHRASSARWR
jgi:hypothetical protein